jgi:hypothetical protein
MLDRRLLDRRFFEVRCDQTACLRRVDRRREVISLTVATFQYPQLLTLFVGFDTLCGDRKRQALCKCNDRPDDIDRAIAFYASRAGVPLFTVPFRSSK